MFIEKVSYQKTFNLGNYTSERIGVEICLNAGEDAKAALDTAKELVESYHKENIPNVEESVIEVDKPSNEKGVAEAIKSCSTIDELYTWELYVRSKPQYDEVFKKRLVELSNK